MLFISFFENHIKFIPNTLGTRVCLRKMGWILGSYWKFTIFMPVS